MQRKRQKSTILSHQTQIVHAHKIFGVLFAIVVTFSLYQASSGMAANFDGNLKSVTITNSLGTNSPPIAIINYNKDGNTVNFDATGSSDPDGKLVSYVWDFGDGTTGNGVKISQQITSQNADITLTVLDDKGGVAISHEVIETQEVPGSYAFSDDYSTNTVKDYTVTHPWTEGGTGKILYDAQGQKLQILTGNNISLKLAQTLPSLETGKFSVDFRPTAKYPSGGTIHLILRQDESNFYKISNTDGYGTLGLFKIIGGQIIDQVAFGKEYSQNNNYHINITFSATKTVVEAFGEVIVINTNKSPISVNSFEVILQQQDAYIDNVTYTK